MSVHEYNHNPRPPNFTRNAQQMSLTFCLVMNNRFPCYSSVVFQSYKIFIVCSRTCRNSHTKLQTIWNKSSRLSAPSHQPELQYLMAKILNHNTQTVQYTRFTYVEDFQWRCFWRRCGHGGHCGGQMTKMVVLRGHRPQTAQLPCGAPVFDAGFSSIVPAAPSAAAASKPLTIFCVKKPQMKESNSSRVMFVNGSTS